MDFSWVEVSLLAKRCQFLGKIPIIVVKTSQSFITRTQSHLLEGQEVIRFWRLRMGVLWEIEGQNERFRTRVLNFSAAIRKC